MRTVTANGLPLPALGQGGWTLGDDPRRAEEEMAALRLGVELGLTLIDTAEMYGDGRSEQLIGRALRPFPRATYQLVSKVYPHNAGRARIFESCEASLRRLGTDHLDLYLLHWRGGIPLAETVQCMEELARAGKILRWGVSNFDTGDMEDLWAVPGGPNCAADQVLYNVSSRGIEYDLLPWLAGRGVAAMAYCPLAQGGTLRRMHGDCLRDPTLARIAANYGLSVPQLMLAFVLRREGLIAIPKAGSRAHVRDNADALHVRLRDADWRAIDQTFWPPTAKMHLDIE